jgi:hypothetical protein
MIIRGNPAGNVGFWSKHLQNDEKNERAEVKEIRGLNADNLQDALWEMKYVADGSRSQGNFMYQANINPYANEHLTPDQWREAIDTLEKNLGLEDHQRVVVEHVKNGRQHYHVIWNRVDVDTMKVADMGGNYIIHERTQAELEAKFELTPTPTPAAADRKAAPELWEHRAAERSGIDPAEVKAEMTELWRTTDSGKAFAAAVEERGYKLAQGDRRDFVIVDHAGDVHSLSRRLDGVKAAAVRERMADVERSELPTVEEARADQRARHSGQEAGQAWANRAEGLASAGNETPAQEPDKAQAETFWERRLRDNRPEASATQENATESYWERRLRENRSDVREPAQATAAQTAEPAPEIDLEPAAEAVGNATDAGLGVADAVAGTVTKLADFVADFLIATPAPQQTPDQVATILAQRRAAGALENICKSIQNGRDLDAEDVRSLSPFTLERIRSEGDDYIMTLTKRIEAERERDDDLGRSMER